MRAIVIGGGISGSTLGMSLHRAGIEAVICEGRPAPDDEGGYFLNLAPNGVAVLDTLGIRDEVLDHGTPTTSIVFQNHRGRKLGENPSPTVLFKRGLLNKALREAAVKRGSRIEFGKRLVGIKSTPGGVKVDFEDGSEEEGDILIGCDGIHSKTRRLIMPDAPKPRYTGLMDSGGFTHAAGVPPTNGVMRMTFGMKGFFGYQVLDSGDVYWFENFHEPTEPDLKVLRGVPSGEYRQKLLDKHRDDHAPIAEVIGSTEQIGHWPDYDLPSLDRWHEGPVCLIGDAAHAMPPSAGQGASLAMEDAVVFARCLRDIPDAREAFATFEDLRRERVELIAREARRNGSRKAPTNAVTRKVRDLVLPFFLRMGVRSAGKVYSYRADLGEEVTT